MLEFLKHWFGEKPESKPATAVLEPDPVPNVLVHRNPLGATVTINREPLDPGAQEEVDQEVIRRSGVPLFKGHVLHAYSKRAAWATSECPRCHEPTQRCCANFIYATDVAPRVMLAPAGFFCTACPTVIIDEDMITMGMLPGLHFRGVVGIHHSDTNEPDLFDTWNGQKTVYIFDEEDVALGLSTVDHMSGHGGMSSSHRNRAKLKHKRKLAAQARKRNRRH